MKDPATELRDYLQILIQRLLYIKELNLELREIKDWETCPSSFAHPR